MLFPQKSLVLFSDGGSRGNPGPSACGFVVYELDLSEKPSSKDLVLDMVQSLEPIYKGGEFMGNTTNNQAEWQGVIAGLEFILSEYGEKQEVWVFLDSELVTKQILGQYKVKNEGLKPYLLQYQKVAKNFAKIHINHVYREKNKLADQMVNEILDQRRGGG